MKPDFITFTDADDFTDVEGMRDLADQYPIEWGILFSPARQGSGRYPTYTFVDKVRAQKGLRLAAHICGEHSAFLLSHGTTSPALTALLADRDFQRVQINTNAVADIAGIQRWSDALAVQPILQCRGDFPDETRALWLLDASGGRGISPASWPKHRPQGILSGYAGGLNPSNVAAAVSVFAACPGGGRFWIDMESGVRSGDDRFSLDLCRQVCEAVYGKH
jgi:phosphoribosylanthranilate isomerase